MKHYRTCEICRGNCIPPWQGGNWCCSCHEAFKNSIPPSEHPDCTAIAKWAAERAYATCLQEGAQVREECSHTSPVLNSKRSVVMSKKCKTVSTIEPGDVVKLNSGGPFMTVQWVKKGDAYCCWFHAETEAHQVQGEVFSVVALRKVSAHE